MKTTIQTELSYEITFSITPAEPPDGDSTPGSPAEVDIQSIFHTDGGKTWGPDLRDDMPVDVLEMFADVILEMYEDGDFDDA